MNGNTFKTAKRGKGNGGHHDGPQAKSNKIHKGTETKRVTGSRDWKGSNSSGCWGAWWGYATLSANRQDPPALLLPNYT